MERRRLQVAMDGILDAMTVSEDDPIRFFLDLHTGKVESRFNPDVFDAPDEADDFDQRFEEDPERFQEIPKYESRDEYTLMRRFADTIDEEDIRERLDVALQGKGAFGRFRDVVFRYPDLKAKWFAARQQALLKEALEWLESIDIEPVYTLGQAEPEPAQTVQTSAPKVTLFDMLLLGAPDGKTELLEGKVYRQFTAPSTSAARALFKSLARELCEYHGIAWRKRFIENTSRYDVERAHLEVDGATVQLSIDVPAWVWKAFAG